MSGRRAVLRTEDKDPEETMPLPTLSPVTFDRRRPLPSTLTVRAARDAYLAENGFDTAGYSAPTYEVDAFGRRFTLRNTDDRKRALPLHDLHHLAIGYGTDLVGEAEVAAWELRAGCRTPIIYALNLAAVLLGLLLAPRRIARAFLDARGATTLYRQEHDYTALLGLTLGELRARLGVPNGGVAREPRRLHETAPLAAGEAVLPHPG
jgi:hypothetical protein